MQRILAGLLIIAFAIFRLNAQQTPDATYFRALPALSPTDLLDEVVDVAADSLGHILVADSRRGSVMILDGQLRAIGQVGRKGSGPGEYREIQAVRGTGNGFVVADRVLRRIYTYAWKGKVLQLTMATKLDFEPYDLCPRQDGKILVLGRRQGLRLHVVDRGQGKVVESGAPFPPNVSVSLSDNLVEGRISCGGDTNTTVITSAWIPKFEIASSRDLRVTRVDSIAPVRRMKILEERDRTTFSSGPQGYHSPRRAFFSGNALFIQAVTIARVDEIDDDSILVFKRDVNGAPVQFWKSLDRIFPTAHDSAIVVNDGSTITLRKVALKSVLRPNVNMK